MLLLLAALQVLGLGMWENDKNSQQEKRINDSKSICFAVHESSNFNGISVSKIGHFCVKHAVFEKTKFLMEGGRLEDHFTFWKHVSL